MADSDGGDSYSDAGSSDFIEENDEALSDSELPYDPNNPDIKEIEEGVDTDSASDDSTSDASADEVEDEDTDTDDEKGLKIVKTSTAMATSALADKRQASNLRQTPIHSETKRVVRKEDRRMRPIMTPYMLAQTVSARVALLCTDPTVFCDVTGMTDPIKMAYKELFERKCPLIIECDVGNGYIEQWSPNEMEINIPIGVYDPRNN